MTPRARHSLEACTLQLHAWKPFQLQNLAPLDSPKPYPFRSKKPCPSDRSTAPVLTPTIAAAAAAAGDLDLSRLTLADDPPRPKDDGLRWFSPCQPHQRKRRRRGSRSVSGPSSDRSGTRRPAYATCSDFPLAAGGTDSSGEMFLNGEGSWGSDASEAARIPRREGRETAGMERESGGLGPFQGGGGIGSLESQGNESGYGSEPGYRGDGELGYDDEYDEEDDEGRQLFWGGRFGDANQMEIVGEKKVSDQKAHHRGRRKKHDWRILAPLR